MVTTRNAPSVLQLAARHSGQPFAAPKLPVEHSDKNEKQKQSISTKHFYKPSQSASIVAIKRFSTLSYIVILEYPSDCKGYN